MYDVFQQPDLFHFSCKPETLDNIVLSFCLAFLLDFNLKCFHVYLFLLPIQTYVQGLSCGDYATGQLNMKKSI